MFDLAPRDVNINKIPNHPPLLFKMTLMDETNKRFDLCQISANSKGSFFALCLIALLSTSNFFNLGEDFGVPICVSLSNFLFFIS